MLFLRGGVNMRLFKYKLKVKNDRSTVTFFVMARNKIQAIEQICICEKCPKRSIIKIERLKCLQKY